MARGDGTILDPNVHEAFIRSYAQQRGLNPDFIAALAAAEGLTSWSAANPNAGSSVDVQNGQPFSFGDFQLNVRNGLGNTALAHGIDPRNPNQWQAADKFAIDYIAATHDLNPWKGDAVAANYLRTHGAGNPSAFVPGNYGSPVAALDPNQVTQAKAWLHSVSDHPNRPGDTDNLNPYFAVKLASVMQQARREGIPVTLGSGYRDKNEVMNQEIAAGKPVSHSAQFDANGYSEHTYGLAADIGGIGAPGSATAKRWYEIATQGGLYNPYGYQNQAEWNHYQMLAKPLNAPENADLLAKLRGAPNIQAAWAATPTPEGGAVSSPIPASAAASGGGGAVQSLPAPPTPLQQMGMALGSGLQALGSGGGGGQNFQDPPPDMPIRMPALSYEAGASPQAPDYLSQTRTDIGAIGGQDMGGITGGAPSMTAMAVGTGTPMTGVGAESPLTYPTAMSRYSRL